MDYIIIGKYVWNFGAIIKYLKGLKGFWQIYQLSFYLNFCNVSPVLINDNTL